MEQVKDLVLKIAQLLVDHPDEVSVNVIEGESSVMFELTVSKGDFGKIVGKQGRNADAIRTILNAIAGKTRKRLKLEIVE
jgi:predicted RNA-binding protein YlqC (UPF0109 family)